MVLVQLPNLAGGVRRPVAAAVHQGRRAGRLTVSAAAPGGRVKEEEEAKGVGKKEKIVIRVSDPVRERRLPPPLFSAPDEPSVPPPDAKEGRRQGVEDGEKAKGQYYVNMGDAIRTLREDLTVAFYREPNFHVYRYVEDSKVITGITYMMFEEIPRQTVFSSGLKTLKLEPIRDDIIFKDPINSFTGVSNYKRIFWALRFTGQIFFKAAWIDIVRIWQPVENVIMVRWIFNGIPRVPWEGNGRFDGTSEYKLDKNGKIYEHKVDNIARNSPTKFKVLLVVELIKSIGCPSTPKPTYFEASCLSLIHWLHFG